MLELAIGTGRVACRLPGAGSRSRDRSPPRRCWRKLRAKPGGDRTVCELGDFADVGSTGRYPLVYLVFNTLFALRTQDEQVRCFENVAAHLLDGGVFAIDAFVPDPARFKQGGVSVSRVEVDRIHVDVTLLDAAAQTSRSQHVVVSAGGVRLYPVSIRWAYPAEIDLMARLAGLRLRERWGSWRKEPFTAASGRHVSIYEK